MSRVRTTITNLQSVLSFDGNRLRRAVRLVFKDAGERSVQIGIAIVDDAQIHELNRRHLGHDYPTDVLSYPLEEDSEKLHGEIVASAETALSSAPAYGWSPEDELCLYVVHGALHLGGYGDQTARERRAMRKAEREILTELGIAVPSHMAPAGHPAEEGP